MTTTITLTERDVIAERPADVPESWYILNAPRPLYGQKCWQGDFVSGIFYVALNPDDYDTADYLQENQRLDAILLRYISRQDVLEWATAYIQEKYPDYDLARLTWENARQSYYHQSGQRERIIEI